MPGCVGQVDVNTDTVVEVGLVGNGIKTFVAILIPQDLSIVPCLGLSGQEAAAKSP